LEIEDIYNYMRIGKNYWLLWSFHELIGGQMGNADGMKVSNLISNWGPLSMEELTRHVKRYHVTRVR
jgi:hypothetical protein